MLDQQTLKTWTEQARRDDWHQTFVGSDIRQMLGEIERLHAERTVSLSETWQKQETEIQRLRAALEEIVDMALYSEVGGAGFIARKALEQK